jgi:hypothetical protein
MTCSGVLIETGTYCRVFILTGSPFVCLCPSIFDISVIAALALQSDDYWPCLLVT